MSEEMQANTPEKDTKKDNSKNSSCSCRKILSGRVGVHTFAYIANILLIVFAFMLFKDSYSAQRIFILLVMVPPVLSILALRKRGDREERDLEKRIRKAYLRKELKSLSEFDI